ncbi:MAG: L-threonine ammonia-lyase [Chlamydiae bacterium]|nr:L-threonine ammonia-lyase [Chlamydiota bacterium]
MNKKDIENCYERIRTRIQRTPLLHSDPLDSRLGKGHKIYLKCENFQITRSYKPRGALNALLKKPKVPVVTRSSGNFAQAVSWAGAQLDIPVTIVMPENVSSIKMEGTRKWGAEVVIAGTTYQEQYDKVDELLRQRGEGHSISAFNDLDVIEGQGTVALEVVEQMPAFRHFFAPVGGGGLMSGCATYLKETDPNYEVIGVEPEGAADFFQSRQQGKICRVENADTIADGLRSPSVGEINWPILNRYVDESMVVPDQAIIESMRYLFEEVGLVIEPSGATSLAALVAHPEWEPKGDMVFVLSGGNVDMKKFMVWMR